MIFHSTAKSGKRFFHLLPLLLIFVAAISCSALSSDAKVEKPIVGAIRWDAWHGARGPVGQVVERTLGPAKYHYRLPFFAKVLADDKVEIRGDSQEVMDREIAYAQAAGVDFPHGYRELGLSDGGSVLEGVLIAQLVRVAISQPTAQGCDGEH